MADMNLETSAAANQQPVISKWAAASLVFVVLCFPSWLLSSVFPFLFFPFIPMLALSAMFCGLAAFARIISSKGRLAGKAYAAAGILAGLVAIVLFGVPLLWVTKSMLYIRQLERKLKSPAIYEPAAKELAQYCQAVTTEVSDTGLGTAWYPETIRNLHPFYGYISPKRANIVFAGGFFHLSYDLELDEDASTEKESVWNLSMHIESDENYLCTVRLDKTNPFTLDKLIETATAGYDSNPQQAHSKIIFLLVFDRPEMAYQACKELTTRNPKHWWPRLTLAFMESARTTTELAGNDFARWVEEYPCFTHYFYLSFFYQKENELQRACDTIEKSLGYPLQESVYSADLHNVYYYASNSITVALKNNKPDLALRICDAALAELEKEHGKYSSAPYWKPPLQKLKAAIASNDQNMIDKWNEYQAWRGSFNPYQARNTNSTQRIKVGNHFFPSDEEVKAKERPYEEMEPLIKEWSGT